MKTLFIKYDNTIVKELDIIIIPHNGNYVCIDKVEYEVVAVTIDFDNNNILVLLSD